MGFIQKINWIFFLNKRETFYWLIPNKQKCKRTVPAHVSRVFMQTWTASSSNNSPPFIIKICFDDVIPCSRSIVDFNVFTLNDKINKEKTI
jgi:hypothetical protein